LRGGGKNAKESEKKRKKPTISLPLFRLNPQPFPLS